MTPICNNLICFGFTGVLRGPGLKVPHGVLFEQFWAPASECPKECFLSAFWPFWAQKKPKSTQKALAQNCSKGTPWGTFRPGPRSTPVNGGRDRNPITCLETRVNGLAHRNRSDFCDLRLRCPSRTPEIARFPRQDKAMLHCDLRVLWKVASDLRFRAAISEPKTPFFLRDFWRFGSVNSPEIASDCDCAILVR